MASAIFFATRRAARQFASLWHNLARRVGGNHVLKLASSQQLYAYWNALRGARGAPERNDIEPGAIRGVLADTFILEFCLKTRFPFRIVGSRTSAMFGRELRETPFLDLWRDEDAGEIARLIESAADGAQPYLVGARATFEGALAFDLEVLLLPLRHHGATHARILGCCAPGVSPPWLGVLPLRPLKISSFRALAPRPLPGLQLRPGAQGEFLRRGHLFVYSSRS